MGKNWGEKDFGKLMVFNNRAGTNYSTVNIFQPTFDTYMWQYQKSNGKYLPNAYSWTYKRPDSTSCNLQLHLIHGTTVCFRVCNRLIW
jgi:hypothetical protein